MESRLIKINADIFIIPNRAGTIGEFCCNQEKMKRHAESILTEFGKNFDENEILVETWMVGSNSDNIVDHGFVFNIEDQYYYVGAGEITRFVPKTAINIKEGETSTLMYRNIKAIPVNTLGDLNRARARVYRENTIDIDLAIKVTANQSNYRYREFGPFEKVLQRVCR